MYVTVLSNLELRRGQAFLNIGSGSGYLSCLAACLLGEGGLSHGIDINEDVVAHSQVSFKYYLSKISYVVIVCCHFIKILMFKRFLTISFPY